MHVLEHRAAALLRGNKQSIDHLDRRLDAQKRRSEEGYIGEPVASTQIVEISWDESKADAVDLARDVCHELVFRNVGRDIEKLGYIGHDEMEC